MLLNMKHYDIFDMHECFKCPSWRRLFEEPAQLSSWIRFQLWAVQGKRSKEMALLAQYAARRLSSMYRKNGALWTAKYLKTSKAVLYKALGGLSPTPPYRVIYPASYAPSGKMVPVSLTRQGSPRFVLPIHRRWMVSGSEYNREKWVRAYLIIWDLYKLVVVETPVDVSPIEGSYLGSLFLPADGPIRDPLRALQSFAPVRNYLQTHPLKPGFSPKLMWTAGPNSPPGMGSLASFAQDAQALLDLSLAVPNGLYLLEELFRPGERWAGDGSFGPRERSTKLLEIFLLQVVASALPDHKVIAGKVGRKVEPVGKTRLFMMMDSISVYYTLCISGCMDC